MITLKKFYNAKNLNKNELILDIETTGLDSSNDQLVLLGIVTHEDNKTYIIQYFAEDNYEEKRLLKIYLDKCKDKKIITFNGDKFDIPFLNNRLIKYKLDPIFPESSDIYKDISRYRKYFNFESMKLMDIERYIGIKRNDPSRYKVISKLTDDIIKRENPRPIMIHNENDLVATEKLVNIDQYFRDKLSIDIEDYKIFLDSIYINNDIAQIILSSSKVLNDSYFTSSTYDLKTSDTNIEINLQVLYGSFGGEVRGHVSLNIFDIVNNSDTNVDPNLLIIRENYIYNYKNILSQSKKIIENHL